MKELLTLDDMVGMSAESRPARKAQVERIQQVCCRDILPVDVGVCASADPPQTLDDVELLQRKISGMISQVREEEAKAKRVPKLKVMAAKAADEVKAAEAKRREEEEQARKRLEAAERECVMPVFVYVCESVCFRYSLVIGVRNARRWRRGSVLASRPR